MYHIFTIRSHIDYHGYFENVYIVKVIQWLSVEMWYGVISEMFMNGEDFTIYINQTYIGCMADTLIMFLVISPSVLGTRVEYISLLYCTCMLL